MVEANKNIRGNRFGKGFGKRRFSGPLVSYPSADSGHGLLQHHLEEV